MHPASVAALLFGSGFSALVYQIAWQRELRLVFGSSTAASAAVLTIFIGGMGAGSLLLGRRADAHPRPLRLYALLELGVAAAAALSPPLVDLARALYLRLGGALALGLAGGTVLRLALSALVLATLRFGARPRETASGPPSGLLTAAAEGVRVAFRMEGVRVIIVASSAVILFAAMLNVAELLLARSLGAGWWS